MEAREIRLKELGMPWVCARSQDDGRRWKLAGPVTRSSWLGGSGWIVPVTMVMGAVAGELELEM